MALNSKDVDLTQENAFIAEMKDDQCKGCTTAKFLESENKAMLDEILKLREYIKFLEHEQLREF